MIWIMFIYNSLTQKKERLQKPHRRALKLFVCGPTVYDYSHIGHAKTYCSFDTIVRYLRARGYKITYLQNITDVDDKIIERAKQEEKMPHEIARHFEQEYHHDMLLLNVTSVDQHARASEFIPAILRQITTLIKKGFAYKTKNGVYFEVKKFKHYGELSRQKINELRAGWRIEPDPEKRDPLDFALWKLSSNEPNWPSPWGTGRPGWHIEDTAITEEYFGPQYDLHGGGVDLKFPHHESEIAQQEAASGKTPFVMIWMHTGFLLVNDEKMSKSLGNFITIRDFLKKYPSIVLRFMIASAHYRSPFNYTKSLAEQSAQAVHSIVAFVTKLALAQTKSTSKGALKIKVREIITAAKKQFIDTMDDDFNTPSALAALFAAIKTTEPHLWTFSKKEARVVSDFLIEHFAILGLAIAPCIAPQQITTMIRRREEYRKKKQFAQADVLRQHITEMGYAIEDTPLGAVTLEIGDNQKLR